VRIHRRVTIPRIMISDGDESRGFRQWFARAVPALGVRSDPGRPAIPGGIRAVVVNVTAVDSTAAGYLNAWSGNDGLNNKGRPTPARGVHCELHAG
jgi:hypothetical protein